MGNSSSSTPNWQSVLGEHEKNENSDKNLEGIAELMTSTTNSKKADDEDVDTTIDSLLENDNLVWMLKSSTSSSSKEKGGGGGGGANISFVHHLTKLGGEDNSNASGSGATRSSQRNKKPIIYAALHGICDTEVQPVQLPLKEAFQMTEIIAPDWNTLKSIDSPEKFTDTITTTNDPNTTSTTTTYSVRQIQMLPPFLYKTLMKSNDSSPIALLVEAVRTIQSHDVEHEKDKDYDKADVFCRHIVAYLWAVAAAAQEEEGKEMMIKDVPMITSVSSEVLEWSKKLHQLYLVSSALKEEEAAKEEKEKSNNNATTTSTTDEKVDENGGDAKTPEAAAPPAAINEKEKTAPSNSEEKSKDSGNTENDKSTENNKEDKNSESAAAAKEDNLKSTSSSSAKSGKRIKVRSWEESFQRLVEYKAQKGDCNVPREYSEDKALGEWVKNQRSVQKTLSKERRAKLEEIGFTFSNTQQDRSNKNWEAQFQKLKVYSEQLKAGKSTKTGDAKEDRALQHWMSVQRQNFKRGTLLEDRKKKLDELGFAWKLKNEYKPRTKNDKQWQQGYDKLKKFYEEHKHCNVPKRPAANRPLWEWVYSQRKAYAEKRLSEDRIAAMEELGMTWDTDMGQVIRDGQWESKYKEAQNFKEQHGHLEVPRSGRFGNTNLLKWLLRQREQHKNDKLPASRKSLLDELGFDFDGHQERREKLLEQLQWKERYQDLQAYKDKHGTANVPESGPETDTVLVKWIAKQQVAYQFRDLEASRKALLDELGVEFGEQIPVEEAKSAKAGGSTSARVIKSEKPVENGKVGEAEEVGKKRKAEDSIEADAKMPPLAAPAAAKETAVEEKTDKNEAEQVGDKKRRKESPDDSEEVPGKKTKMVLI